MVLTSNRLGGSMLKNTTTTHEHLKGISTPQRSNLLLPFNPPVFFFLTTFFLTFFGGIFDCSHATTNVQTTRDTE